MWWKIIAGILLIMSGLGLAAVTARKAKSRTGESIWGGICGFIAGIGFIMVLDNIP